jgi:thiosulfate sulfurtransferase
MPNNTGANGYQILTPEQVQARLERNTSAPTGDEPFLLDVRDSRAYHAGHISDAISVPADVFADRYQREIEPEDPVILVCERGETSEAAARFLVSQGFTDVATMAGGMQIWSGPLESA